MSRESSAHIYRFNDDNSSNNMAHYVIEQKMEIFHWTDTKEHTLPRSSMVICVTFI